MTHFDSIYEVEKIDYVNFVQRLQGGNGIVKYEENDTHILSYIKSKSSGDVWCARLTDKESMTHTYYIINYPKRDEWIDAIPKMRYTLTTPEEVQAVLNGFSGAKGEKCG